MPDLHSLNYKQRLAAAWPDPAPMGPGPGSKPAAAAPAPAPAAPAAERPPFLELARARSASEHAKRLSELAWPDDLQPAGSMGDDNADPAEESLEAMRSRRAALEAQLGALESRIRAIDPQG